METARHNSVVAGISIPRHLGRLGGDRRLRNILNRTGMLTHNEEIALALRWVAHKDEAAMHRLVVAHMPLAEKWARRYAKGRSFEDLQAEAYVGLLEAVRRFDPSKGFRFSTFAQHWVRASVTECVFRDRTVRGSTSAQGKAEFWRGEAPCTTISLETPVSDGDDPLVLGDVLVSDDPLPDERVECAIDGERRRNSIQRALRTLPVRERKIVRERHLAPDNPATLDDLGDKLGISKERVRQLETRALKTLGKKLEALA